MATDGEEHAGRQVRIVFVRMPQSLLETMAIAWVQIQIIKEHMDRPDTGLNMLRGCWEEVGKIVRREPDANMVAVQVLQEYFTHSGDWEAMQRCLASNAQRHPGAHKWDELLSQLMPKARTEYDQYYGKGE
jgi:hypothetical protein